MKLLTILAFSFALLHAQTAPDPAQVGRRAVELLTSGKYAEAFQMFSPDLQKAIPEPNLEKMGDTIKSWGPLAEIGQAEVRKSGTGNIVTLPTKFATHNIKFQMVVNAAGQVAILQMTPGDVPWQHPPYAEPFRFEDRQVTIDNGDWKFSGLLMMPNGNGPFPAVVMVHGSGPNDADETVGGVKVFKDIAEGLASRGIASLRYDKRTRLYAAKMARMSKMTVKEETTDDAVKALAFLRQQHGVDPARVFLIGHSLGGYVAPRIAEADGKLAGIIILSANVRPLEDIIVEQSEYLKLPQKELEAIKVQAARVKQLEPADSDAPPLLGMPVSYLLDLKDYNPAAEAKKLNVRMLVLQGERDYQVTMKDFALWKSGLAGKKDVTFRSYPALNHLFVAGEGKSTEAEYQKPGHVSQEVIEDIVKFIGK